MFKSPSAPLESDPNRILRRTSGTLFHTAYEQAGQVVWKPITTLEAALGSEEEGYPSLPTQKPTTARVSDLYKSNLLALQQVCKMNQQLAGKDAKGIRASHVDPLLPIYTEKVLPDAFFAKRDAADGEMRTS